MTAVGRGLDSLRQWCCEISLKQGDGVLPRLEVRQPGAERVDLLLNLVRGGQRFIEGVGKAVQKRSCPLVTVILLPTCSLDGDVKRRLTLTN